MDISSLISNYGIPAIFIGCFVEGETVAIAGGVMAHRHLLILWQVTLAAISGAYISDISYFLLARRFHDHPRLHSITQRTAFANAIARLDKGATQFACVFRFIPGMRIIGPVALAHSKISTLKFLTFALIAAVIWGVLFTIAGQAVGRGIVALLGHHLPIEILASVLALILTGFTLRTLLRYRKNN